MESASIVDLPIISAGYIRPVSDVFSLTDFVETLLAKTYAQLDTIAALDFSFNNIFKVVDGEQNYTTRDYLLEDYLAPGSSEYSIIADTTNLRIEKLVTDSISILDLSITANNGSLGDSIEQATVIDTAVLISGYSRNITDSSALVDTVSLGTQKLITDSLIIVEFISPVLSYNRSITDTVNATDDYDGLAVIDDDQIALVGKSIFETIPVLDVSSTISVYNRNITDTATTADLVALTNSYNRNILDTYVLVENISRSSGYNRQILDNIVTADLITITSNYNRSALDTSTITDVTTRTVGYNRGITDPITVPDNVFFNTGKSVTDNFSIAETVSLTGVYNRSVLDSTTLTENVSTLRVYQRSVLDSAPITDLVSRVIAYNPTLSDTTSLTDLVLLNRTYTRPVLETATLSDVVNLLLFTTFNQLDTSNISDLARLTLNKNITESLVSSDLVTKSMTKSLQESTTISGLITIVSQNYFAENYVDIGYTGSTILQEAG